ncbi:MAG TPA: DUF4864 domain-containing protein [Myxococcota bacterium]|nr:DUF4864 domain-containing protein [Myxococcota bacterium]
MSWKSMLMATAAVASEDEEFELEVITEHDAAEIRMIIREQIAAFRAGDGPRAWRLSSDAIHQTFGDPDRLLALIRARYEPLLRLRQLTFGEWQITPDGVGLQLEVVDDTMGVHHVVYLLVRDERHAWKVNGALLEPRRELADAA